MGILRGARTPRGSKLSAMFGNIGFGNGAVEIHISNHDTMRGTVGRLMEEDDMEPHIPASGFHQENSTNVSVRVSPYLFFGRHALWFSAVEDYELPRESCEEEQLQLRELHFAIEEMVFR